MTMFTIVVSAAAVALSLWNLWALHQTDKSIERGERRLERMRYHFDQLPPVDPVAQARDRAWREALVDSLRRRP